VQYSEFTFTDILAIYCSCRIKEKNQAAFVVWKQILQTVRITHVAPPQRVRMPHQTLSVKSTQICVQVVSFFTITHSSKGVYLITASLFTPSAVNGLSDKERKLSACEINLAGPLVPEDKENKLFSRYGVVSEGLRSSLHRYDHEKSCTISWKQTLNTEYTGIVGAHPLSSNSSCSIMHN